MPITGMGISTDSDSVFRLTNDQITVETRTVVISQATTDRVCDHCRGCQDELAFICACPRPRTRTVVHRTPAVVADVRSRCATIMRKYHDLLDPFSDRRQGLPTTAGVAGIRQRSFARTRTVVKNPGRGRACPISSRRGYRKKSVMTW
jgi:hypothetical protein